MTRTTGGAGRGPAWLSRLGRFVSARLWWAAPAGALMLMLALPVLALLARAAMADLATHVTAPAALSALRLSLSTSALALVLTVMLGTPLAYAFAHGRRRLSFWAEWLIDLPVVLPPSVAGLALLITFGRRGLLGPALESAGLAIPFTTFAVVIAQMFVSAPLFVRGARIGFAAVPHELEEAARVEGAGQWALFRFVMLPLAWRALLGGAITSWLRALGEFGATIMFAGNLPGITQTMPLAIYLSFERDTEVALALSAMLVAVSGVLLLAVRRLDTLADWERKARD